MTELIKLLEEHRSERKFTGDKLPPDKVRKIVTATQRVPSSMNAQIISVLTSQKDEVISSISDTIGQPFIKKSGLFVVFLADYNKMDYVCKIAGLKSEMKNRVEALISSSVDAGIHVQAMSLVAQSMGYGTCMIGGIRKKIIEISELLKLPKNVLPLVGLAIGKISERAHIKPRLPISAFQHTDRYSDDNYESAIKNYDQILINHWQETNRSEGLPYSKMVASRWSINYYPNLFNALKEKGIGLE